MTLPLDQQLAEIRAKCIEANPEKVWDHKTYHDYDVTPIIRLADVLYAVGEKDDTGLGLLTVTGGGLMQYSENVTVKHSPRRVFYDLRADDLTQQSHETIAFIHSLLTV